MTYYLIEFRFFGKAKHNILELIKDVKNKYKVIPERMKFNANKYKNKF
jgi:hypothetical protein|tara:strand:- start:169 stop:312 length:144 start_codon:yes stop_codon:yes gene_type:complete